MSPPLSGFLDTVKPAIVYDALRQRLIKKRAAISPSPSLNKENRTCFTNDNSPLSTIFPGSQNAFFNFFFTFAALSMRSILESSSDDDILPPAKPGTENKFLKNAPQDRVINRSNPLDSWNGFAFRNRVEEDISRRKWKFYVDQHHRTGHRLSNILHRALAVLDTTDRIATDIPLV